MAYHYAYISLRNPEMATIINTPGQNDSGNSATIWVMGLIVIVLIVLFALFIWPKFGPSENTAATPTQQGTEPQPVNNYNTVINSTSTTNNSTTSSTNVLPL